MARKRKRRVGRPHKPESARKSVMLTARVEPDLKEALERARQKSKHTLSEEIAFRLRTSLSKRDDFFGQEHERYLAMVVARVATWVRRSTRANWRDDRYTFEALRAGIYYILNHPLIEPAGPPDPPQAIKTSIALAADVDAGAIAAGIVATPPERDHAPQALGQRVAVEILRQMIGSGPIPPSLQVSGRMFLTGSPEWHHDLPRAGQVLGVGKKRKEPKE